MFESIFESTKSQKLVSALGILTLVSSQDTGAGCIDGNTRNVLKKLQNCKICFIGPGDEFPTDYDISMRHQYLLKQISIAFQKWRSNLFTDNFHPGHGPFRFDCRYSIPASRPHPNGVSGFGTPFKISDPVFLVNLVAQPIDQSGMLSWDLPSDTGGFEIASVNVRVNGHLVALGGTVTQYNATGLQNGQITTVEVSVSTIHGEPVRQSTEFIPFSDPIIEAVTVREDNWLAVKISLNGRRITKWAAFAHDSSPSQPEELFQQSTESNTSISGNYTINIPFSSFDQVISKWVVVVIGEGVVPCRQTFVRASVASP